MMKKSRQLITLLVMLVAAGGYAQDSYVEAIKEFCHLNGNAGQITSALKQLNSALFISDGSMDLDQLAENYFENQLLPKVVGDLTSNLKERNVTEADIRKINSLFTSSAGQDFVTHRQAWTEALRNDIVTQMMQHLPQILSGNLSEPVQPKSEIGPGYIDKFKNILGTGITESFMKVMDESSGSWKLDMLPEGVKKNLKSWMETNLPTFAMNSAYGIITEDDLDFLSRLSSESVFKSLQDVTAVSLGQIESMGANIISDYVDWMKAQGVTPVDGISNLFKLM